MLNERMKSLDPEKQEMYKFLGCEQAKGISKETILD
jgi:hypothetical protein